MEKETQNISEWDMEGVMEYLRVDWITLTKQVMDLARKIKGLDEKPTVIVAIARGGLTIAHLLSDLLDLPVASFTVSSYTDLQVRNELKMSFEVGGRLEGQHVLLIDDVSDTGTTFIRSVAYLQGLGAAKITTASLFVKPQAKFLPDVHADETDKWIIFPFDMLETIRKLQAKWLEADESAVEIRRRLTDLGFSELYLEFFFSTDGQ